MTELLTRAEWEAELLPIDPNSAENRALSLNTYACKCDAHKATWRIPFRYSHNLRFEVYLETLLSEGVNVPDAMILQAEEDANRYHDVPLLGKRQAEIDTRQACPGCGLGKLGQTPKRGQFWECGACTHHAPTLPEPENDTELRQLSAFEAGEDSPLFSGSPQTAKASDYNTTPQPDQPALFDRRPLIAPFGSVPKRTTRPASPPIIGGLFD